MSHKLKAWIVVGLITVSDYFVCGFRFISKCFRIVHCCQFVSGFHDCFSGFYNFCLIFTDQAQAIHDKVAAGGVGLEGAVGGAQLAGGVVVAQAPHYAGDNGDSGDSDEDSNVSYTETI